MKKLKLKLAGKEMLSKEQMKKVTGGYDGECWEPVVIGCYYPDNNHDAGLAGTYIYYGCAYVVAFDNICENMYPGSEWRQTVCICGYEG